MDCPTVFQKTHKRGNGSSIVRMLLLLWLVLVTANTYCVHGLILSISPHPSLARVVSQYSATNKETGPAPLESSSSSSASVPISISSSSSSSFSLGNEGWSRRSVFFSLLPTTPTALLLLLSTTSTPAVANAAEDEMHTIMSRSLALRNVKSSLKRLTSDAFADSIAFQQYDALRKSLRESPFADLRRSCTALITTGSRRTQSSSSSSSSSGVEYGDDEEDAAPISREIVEDRTRKYKNFIRTLEQLDSTAAVGARYAYGGGRDVSVDEMTVLYNATIQSLTAFVESVNIVVVVSVVSESDPMSLCMV